VSSWGRGSQSMPPLFRNRCRPWAATALPEHAVRARASLWRRRRARVITCLSPLRPDRSMAASGCRSGFEVAYFHLLDDGYRIEGCTAAIEGAQTWAVDYAIALDANWTTRRARISGRSVSGLHSSCSRQTARGTGWSTRDRASPERLPRRRPGVIRHDQRPARAPYGSAGRAAVLRLPPCTCVLSHLAVERLEQT